MALAIAFLGGVVWENWRDDPWTEPLEMGLLVAGIYVAASIFVLLINGLAQMAFLFLIGGKFFQQAYLDDLRRSVPPPDRWKPKRWDYLVSLADDEDYLPEQRVKAAGLYAASQAVIRQAGFFGGITLSTAADQAAMTYANESPEYVPHGLLDDDFDD